MVVWLVAIFATIMSDAGTGIVDAASDHCYMSDAKVDWQLG